MTVYKMHLNFSLIKSILLSSCILLCGTSCVYINEELGQGFIPTDHRYDTYVTAFPLTDITMQEVDSLSGYSSSKLTVGAIKSQAGISERSSAVTLIPMAKIDVGKNPKVKQFHFALAKDTLSYTDANQRHIIQNVNVYALSEKIADEDGYLCSELKVDIAGGRITDGIPVYGGGDSLSFDFSTKFAQDFVDKLVGEAGKEKESVYDSIGAFTEKLPGIYISVDEPQSDGGRINIFQLEASADLQEYTVYGGYAQLKITADYGDRKQVDTSFLFFAGGQDFTLSQGSSAYYTGTQTPQYALNLSSSEYIEREGCTYETEGGKIIKAHAVEKIYVDGGDGFKPRISAKEIQERILAEFASKGIDPEGVIINKATIKLPFDHPADHELMNTFPYILSPTCRLRSEDSHKYITYAGLTDSSIASENQGNINTSTSMFTPDISHHVQQIIPLEDEKDYESRDIWFLIMNEEKVEQENNSSTSDYYQNLLYNNYYNSMYDPYGYGGYGYGGYGYGYGGYGYGYGGYGYNYLDYMMMSAYASGSNTSEDTNTEVDRDRFYEAVLRGPGADSGFKESDLDGLTDQQKINELEKRRIPMLKVTYSVRKKTE